MSLMPSSGIDLRSQDGFDASFFRDDGKMRVRVTDRRITISLSSQTADRSQLSIGLNYVLRTFGVKNKKHLLFRVDGITIRPVITAGQIVFTTNTGPQTEQQVEIAETSISPF